MSESFEIDAQPRSDTGKGASRRLRRVGQVPGIIYGAHRDPSMIAMSHNELIRHLAEEAFYSHILQVNLPDGAERVVLKDLQRHPARPFVMHVDFQRIVADEKLRMNVPLHFVNESKSVGVKSGGVVSHNVTDIEVSCLPADLPEYIEIDMTDLAIGDSVLLSQVALPPGVELAASPDPDIPVVMVVTAHVAKEEGEEAGETEEPGPTVGE